MAEELTFHLEDFDGPLELLLALVAKHKMDLHNIPILQLIDQYTRTVEQADPQLPVPWCHHGGSVQLHGSGAHRAAAGH